MYVWARAPTIKLISEFMQIISELIKLIPVLIVNVALALQLFSLNTKAEVFLSRRRSHVVTAAVQIPKTVVSFDYLPLDGRVHRKLKQVHAQTFY